MTHEKYESEINKQVNDSHTIFNKLDAKQECHDYLNKSRKNMCELIRIIFILEDKDKELKNNISHRNLISVMEEIENFYCEFNEFTQNYIYIYSHLGKQKKKKFIKLCSGGLTFNVKFNISNNFTETKN